MFILAHRLEKQERNDWQLCETRAEAQQQVNSLLSIHGIDSVKYALCQVVESSEPQWLSAQIMELDD